MSPARIVFIRISLLRSIRNRRIRVATEGHPYRSLITRYDFTGGDDCLFVNSIVSEYLNFLADERGFRERFITEHARRPLLVALSRRRFNALPVRSEEH